MQNLTPAVAFAALLTTAFGAAQETQATQDPIANVVRIRVIGAEDAIPRPGVVVHLRGDDDVQIDEHGYMVAEDEAVRRLRHATMVCTDPEGRAQLTTNRRLQWWDLNIAEPYLRHDNAKLVDGEWLIRVSEHEPVGVRVIDADGKAIAGFPVALHAAGADMAVAITDKTGRAMLGLAKDFTARAVICPAGWIGPHDAFPTVAESLAGRRGATMQLPPYGAMRLKRMRGGVLEPGPVRAQQFSHPTAYAHLNAQIQAGTKRANGVIYPYVALGIRVTSYPQFGGKGLREFDGPTNAGEVRDINIDLGPRMNLRCRGVAVAAVRGSVRVRLVTDAGQEEVMASHEGKGNCVIDLGRAIKGTRLLRVDVDVAEHSVSQACDHSLQTATLDLGEFVLLAHKPQLRGRVLDAAGQPVAGANVVISPINQRNGGYRTTTNADGWFESSGPVLRDQDGVATQLFAMARQGELASEFVQGVGGEVTLKLQPAVPSTRQPIATNGSVVVQLTGNHDPAKAQQLLRLQGRFGVGRFPKTKSLPGGGTEITFYGLRGDTYQLLASAPDYGRFVLFDDLVVPGDGPCEDPRLLELDPSEHVRKVIARVVDEQAVPIAGARFMLPESVRTTDGTGHAALYVGRTATTEGTIEMPGKRTIRRNSWPDDLVVTLEQARELRVQVVGLPADLPRSDLEIWLRDDVRERFAGPREMLQTEDTVSMPIPARGSYHLHLLVTRRERNSSRSSTVHIDPTAIEIGDNVDRTLQFVLDDAVIVRLRELTK
jgi:hypothetical protein